MRHRLRRTSLLLVPFTLLALGLGIPAASPDDLENVTLSCSDGTNLGLTLSVPAVTGLTNATTAMTLFPAGLTCDVSTQAVPTPGGNSRKDTAVGGGDQFFTQPKLEAPCKVNFSFSAHTPSNSPTLASGSFNESVPGGCAGLGNTGELRVAVNCLDVSGISGKHADMSGRVTKATGQFAEDGFVAGNPAFISADDNGGAPIDQVGVAPVPTRPSVCGGTMNEAQTTHGRVNVNAG